MDTNTQKIQILLMLCFCNFDFSFAIDCSQSPKNNLTKLQIEVICSHTEYDVRPVKVNTTVINVAIQFRPKRISIVEHEEITKVAGFIMMEWPDEYCKWSPADYGSIDRVEIETYDLWHPKLTTADHYSNGWYEFLDESDSYVFKEMVVDFNGNVRARITATLYGPCKFDLYSWPNDVWSCEITLAKRNEDDGLVIVQFVNESALDLSMIETDKDWVITEITDPAIDDLDKSQHIALRVKLRRRAATIEKIFVIPAFISLTIAVIPFWLTNKIIVRMAVHFVSIIIQIMFLQFVFNFVTGSHGLRNIEMYDLYLHGLYINLVGLLLTALNAKFTTKVEDPPKFIVDFLSMVAHIPYFGVFCSVLMNNDHERTGAFETDAETLLKVTTRSNPKWEAFLKFIDASTFFLILIYIFVRWVL